MLNLTIFVVTVMLINVGIFATLRWSSKQVCGYSNTSLGTISKIELAFENVKGYFLIAWVVAAPIFLLLVHMKIIVY